MERPAIEPWKGVEDEIEQYRVNLVKFISKTEANEQAFSRWVCWLWDHKSYFGIN